MEEHDPAIVLEDSSLFGVLGPDEIQGLLKKARMERHPKGALIYEKRGVPQDCLRLIVSGSVKVTLREADQDEVLVDYRGRGEAIGFLSITGADGRRGDAMALQDTVCCAFDRETIFDLIRINRAFAGSFFEELMRRYVSKPKRASFQKGLLYGGGERLLFATPVGEMVTRRLVTLDGEASIREAASLMSSSGISALLVVDRLGLPTGIVTDRDFRERALARGKDPSQPVKSIQSVSLVRAEVGEPCIEALFKMIHYNIRHLPVVEGGGIIGVLTDQDLLRLQGTTPLSTVKAIENQINPEGLAPILGQIREMLGLFINEGLRHGQILLIVNEMYERLFSKAFELVEKRLGTAPAEYCLVFLGDAGRRDDTFLRGMEAGIIYKDPASSETEKVCRDYFETLLKRFSDSVGGMGLETRDGSFFAGSLGSWKRLFSEWTDACSRKAVEASLPFFDMRVQRGDAGLAEELREAVRFHLKKKQLFLDVMASNIIKTSPPITAFRRFLVERSGPNKGRFDLGSRCLRPLVDLARLYALKNGLQEGSTLERLAAVKEKDPSLGPLTEEIGYSFQYISDMCLKAGYAEWKKNKTAQAWVDPMKLNRLERDSLKRIFSFVAGLQVQIRQKHQPTEI
jgi:CBS domain-containing protein